MTATEPDVSAEGPEPTSSVVAEAPGEEGPNEVYHNPNPPFATDGRGRVVWSNRGERDGSGQAQAQNRKATDGGEPVDAECREGRSV
jgi:hypothetical protein